MKSGDFYTKFKDVKKGLWDINKDITVNYYVLKPYTPDYVLKYLLYSINSAAKPTCTPNGVWEFIAVYKYVCLVCVCVLATGLMLCHIGRNITAPHNVHDIHGVMCAGVCTHALHMLRTRSTTSS